MREDLRVWAFHLVKANRVLILSCTVFGRRVRAEEAGAGCLNEAFCSLLEQFANCERFDQRHGGADE